MIELSQKGNVEIYDQWSKYQEERGVPKPQYPVGAYTQESIDMWSGILESK